MKIKTYNPTTSLSTLSMVPISLASATQRAGRAGRTSSGVCYRLYPESTLSTLLKTTPAELTRVDLTTPILQLKALGIDDLVKFEWVTNPPAEGVLRALEGLIGAGMVGPEDGRLTPVGEKVAEWPVDVNIARAVSQNLCPRGTSSIHHCWGLIAIQLEGVQMLRRNAHHRRHGIRSRCLRDSGRWNSRCFG